MKLINEKRIVHVIKKEINEGEKKIKKIKTEHVNTFIFFDVSILFRNLK